MSPLSRWGRASWNLLGVVIATYLAAIVVGRLRLVLVPVLVAVLVATQLVPVMRLLERAGLPSLAAVWATFLGLIAGFTGVVYLVAPSVSSEIDSLGSTLNSSGDRLDAWLTDGPLNLSQSTVDSLSTSFSTQISGNQSRLVHGALASAPVALEVVAAILVTFVLTFFFVKDGDLIVARLTGMVRPARRPGLQRFLDSTWTTLSGYVRGTAVNGAVNASVLALTLWVLGVPLIVPIALITIVGSFVPIVGGIASGGLAAAVALAEKGPNSALVLVAATVLIHHLEAYVIGPMVLGRTVHLHPVAVILGISAGSIAFGILGAFIAVPVIAIASSAIDTANADARFGHAPAVGEGTGVEGAVRDDA